MKRIKICAKINDLCAILHKWCEMYGDITVAEFIDRYCAK